MVVFFVVLLCFNASSIKFIKCCFKQKYVSFYAQKKTVNLTEYPSKILCWMCSSWLVLLILEDEKGFAPEDWPAVSHMLTMIIYGLCISRYIIGGFCLPVEMSWVSC